jgi:hypothetical protein
VHAHAPDTLPDRVRAGCAWVAGQASSVRVDEHALGALAAALAAVEPGAGDDRASADPARALPPDRELRAAFVLCLDAINFGSGWWPTIRKREGLSGYFTIATALAERFAAAGAWPAGELAALDRASIAEALDQRVDHPLMALYGVALRDVGEHVASEHGGAFAAVFDAARGSAPALAGALASWEAFADTSRYRGREVPFFKRAQIAAVDGHEAGVATLGDRARLTAFADNLVPHVLRVEGVLRLTRDLERRIDRGELLEHGSEEEVELRACAVHAVELLAHAIGTGATPAQLDGVLWRRGQAARYKARPRPRCRTTAY